MKCKNLLEEESVRWDNKLNWQHLLSDPDDSRGAVKSGQIFPAGAALYDRAEALPGRWTRVT